MKTILVLAAAVALTARGDICRGVDGTLHFRERTISMGATLNWDNWHASAMPTFVPGDRRQYVFKRGRDEFGSGEWTGQTLTNGAVRLRNVIRLDADVGPVDFFGTRIYLQHGRWAGASWRTDTGQGGTLPLDKKRAGLFSGAIRRLEVTARGETAPVVFTFPEPTRLHISNDSAWCDKFSLRLATYGKLPAGTVVTNRFDLSVPGETLAYRGLGRVRIEANGEWIPMEMKKGVAKGGVTDFSAFARVDAPAGKYGWLRRVGDHFEFEGRPGERVRFCGANFVSGCCFPPTDEIADELVDRVIRSGYNTIRLHHFDCNGGIVSKDDPARLRFDPKVLDRFDRFVAKCIEKGVYLTIDLFSLRRPLWRALGYDRDGDIHFQAMKVLLHTTDAGFENWKAYAQQLLNHVNPYTGRAYKDEPGIPLVCLVNEGAISQSWSFILKDELLQKLIGIDDIRHYRTGGNPDFENLCMDIEEKSWARMKAAVKETGAKALLTDINNGPHFARKNDFREREFDYFDNHAYVDHPQWLGERLKLPARQRNVNLLDYDESPLDKLASVRIKSMPYTVTEWNVNCPSPYRSAGGLYMGAVASKFRFDGLWRFTWSHGLDGLLEGKQPGNGFFDVMRDPVMQANDRAFQALYQRGDADGLDAMKRDDAAKTFVVETPKTQGGFAFAGGKVKTSALEVRLWDADATVTAIAVDGAADLVRARRIFFSYLTDVQTEGRTWMDPERTIIEKLGDKRLLAHAGRAEVALRLVAPEGYEVWACETDGARRERVSVTAADGKLTFAVRIARGSPVRLVYEIVAASSLSADWRMCYNAKGSGK